MHIRNFSISGGFILVTDHRVLLLETICVSPVVFLVFAALETLAPFIEKLRSFQGFSAD